MVHQELSPVRTLTVAENVYLGVQPTNRFGSVDWRRMLRGAREQLARLASTSIRARRWTRCRSGCSNWLKLARVLFSGARIIILDEPTSALSPPEVQRLFAVLRRLREAGRGLIFISHFLDDVLAICDRVTVFRNGRAVADSRGSRGGQGLGDRKMIGEAP